MGADVLVSATDTGRYLWVVRKGLLWHVERSVGWKEAAEPGGRASDSKCILPAPLRDNSIDQSTLTAHPERINRDVPMLIACRGRHG
jgi:hypothetical protein